VLRASHFLLVSPFGYDANSAIAFHSLDHSRYLLESYTHYRRFSERHLVHQSVVTRLCTYTQILITMARLDSWIKTRVLAFVKPRHHKKLTTRDITISKPIPSSLHHWSPVMRSQKYASASAEDLLGSPSSSTSSEVSTPSLSHSRDSSDSSGITIVVHSPPPSTPPPNFFPHELPLPTRAMWDEAPVGLAIGAPTHWAPLPRPQKKTQAPPEVVVPSSPPILFSETPSPTSYFKTAFEIDVSDLMGAEGVFGEWEVTDVRGTIRKSKSMGGFHLSEYNRI